MSKALVAGIAITLGCPGAVGQQSWSPMHEAPRDGTIIEIENNRGSHPWRDVYCWQEDEGWVSVRDSSRSLMRREDTLKWRLYEGEIASYVGPTAGTQTTSGHRMAGSETERGFEETEDEESWWDGLLAWFSTDESHDPIDQYLEPDDPDATDFGSPGAFAASERVSASGERLGFVCERTPPDATVVSQRAP